MSALILLHAWLPAALACGPHFPTPVLHLRDEELWATPLLGFVQEVPALYPPEAGSPPLPPYVALSTLEADLQDLRAVMGGAVPEAALRTLREKTHPDPWAMEPATAPLSAADIPPGLPAEFDLYLQGAVAWHAGDIDAARQRWQALLELPPEQRRHRSVWAAYMLGRLPGPPEEQARWMEQARALAAEGFADSAGLALASYGWQANVRLWDQKDFAGALPLYLAQLRAGDPSGPLSLAILADEVLDSGDLDAAARDPDLGRLVTLRLLSRHGHERTRAWLEAVERAGAGSLAGADRLAGVAYQAGDMDMARRWLQQAPPSPLGHWIGARLAMRDGDLAQAEALLASAAEGFGPQTEWNVHWRDGGEYAPLRPAHEALAERGAVLVQQGRFPEALAAFLEADHWLDAAYLAERILTLDELRAFVDALPPAPAPAPAPAAEGEGTGWDPRAALRDLLARRMVRAGRHQEALPYFASEDTRRVARDYADAIDRAADRRARRLEEAEALWQAARLARWSGLEIMGTELAPDFAYSGGAYEGPGVTEYRLEGSFDGQKYAPTPEERRRVQQNGTPERRFHYRYLAAEHAWKAAALLPDDDQGTLKILCQAGSWLKERDPQAADPFYKAMVNRGWNHPLGTLADDLRWFPSATDCAMDDLVLDDPGAVKDGWGCHAAPAPLPRLAPLLAAALIGAVGRRRRR